MFDVMIRNGRIADGTGTPWYRGDIGISDGKIQRIGNLSVSYTHLTLPTNREV